MGEMGVWVEKQKTVLQEENYILRYGEKGCRDIWARWECET